METNVKEFTPEESLKLISQTISNFKKNYRADSFHFLLWGWVISLASISQFVILKVLLEKELYDKIGMFSLVNWFVFIAVGMIILIAHRKKQKTYKSVYSHLDRFINTMWQASALGFFLTAAICQILKVYSPVPFMLIIAGMSTLTTGIIIRFKPLIVGGFIFFIMGTGSSFASDMYQALFSAAAIIAGYIVPGYLLRYSK